MRGSRLLSACVALALSGCLFTQAPKGGDDTGDDAGGAEVGASAERTCDDGVDNDGDELTDCDDPDCARQACAAGVPGAVCVDGGGDCRGGEPVALCGDDLDNDGDGLSDCDDPDCAERSCLCAEAGCLELCDNQVNALKLLANQQKMVIKASLQDCTKEAEEASWMGLEDSDVGDLCRGTISVNVKKPQFGQQRRS